MIFASLHPSVIKKFRLPEFRQLYGTVTGNLSLTAVQVSQFAYGGFSRLILEQKSGLEITWHLFRSLANRGSRNYFPIYKWLEVWHVSKYSPKPVATENSNKVLSLIKSHLILSTVHCICP